MKDWTAILPLLGVAVGWMLNQATAIRAERLADHRTIKEALYSLLELHGLLTGLERMYTLLPELATMFRKQAPAAPLPEFEADIDRYLTRILHEALTPFIGQQLTDLKTDYAASLLKLATVDPVSAYRLRGQQNVLEELPRFMENWQRVMTTHLGEVSPDTSEAMVLFRQQKEPQQVAETRAVVREVIQELASQLTKRTHKQVTDLLAKPSPNGSKLLTELEEQMRQMVATLAAQGIGK
jgi:hypothetical protein